MLYACSPRQDREYEAAKNSAAGSLSLRPHSRKELEIKLKDKGYSEGAILKALDRLKELVCPCKQFAAHCLSLQTSTGQCVTRQCTILCVMQHWQYEVAKMCRGAQKPCCKCMILMTLCALMSLCIAEVHSSPMLQSTLTCDFWNTHSQCHYFSNGQFFRTPIFGAAGTTKRC